MGLRGPKPNPNPPPRKRPPRPLRFYSSFLSQALRDHNGLKLRDPTDGNIVRLLVGVADRKTRNWLSQPSVMAAEFVARCIQSGQAFQVFAYGQLGPFLAVADGHLVAADGEPTEMTLDDLPPYTHSATQKARPPKTSAR